MTRWMTLGVVGLWLVGCQAGPRMYPAVGVGVAGFTAQQASLRMQVQRYFQRQFDFHDRDDDQHLNPNEAAELELTPADFAEADANRDGKLTFLELCPPINLDDWVQRLRHDAADLIKAGDRDGDKLLTPEEYAGALAAAPTIYVEAPRPDAARWAYGQLDRAPTGVIQVAEAADVLALLFAQGYEYTVSGTRIAPRAGARPPTP